MAIQDACAAAAFCSAATALFTILALYGMDVLRLNFNAWSLVDAAVFAVIAFGLYRASRVAAVAGLVLYVGERAQNWMEAGITNPVIAVIFVLAFVGGVRGTFAMYRFNHAPSPGAPGQIPA